MSDVPAVPTPSIFGFNVRSSQPLQFLRAGGGVETLDVVTATEPRPLPTTAPIADWVLGGGGPDQEFRGTLYQIGREFEFRATDAGAYRIDPEKGWIEMPAGGSAIVREQRLWGVPTTLCYMQRGDLPLHAAAVEVGGGAVVLAAPSRFGKTTLAAAFHDHGYRVLSEDLSCCRPGPTPVLLPGPALLRLRADVFGAKPPSGTHVVLQRSDRIFLTLDDDRRGSGAPIPIRAIVFLFESDGDLRLERAAPAVALADLWALNFRLRTADGRARSFQQLSRLVDAVPAWNLYRPLQLGSLKAVVEYIVELVG